MRANNFCIEPYAVEDAYVTLAFSTTGAAILGWFCNSFAQEVDPRSVFRVMESECPKGPTDLFVLPHFAGSGTPHMDPFSTGAVLGLRFNTTRGDIYKACMEGICFEMLQNAQLLKSMGTSITSMTCVGGGTKSEALLQVKADIMGIPIHRLKTQESGTTALAMLCAVACRDFSDMEEAATNMVNIDKTFTPNEKYHRVYQERFSIYRNIYPSIASL
jgi:xylulokinase